MPRPRRAVDPDTMDPRVSEFRVLFMTRSFKTWTERLFHSSVELGRTSYPADEPSAAGKYGQDPICAPALACEAWLSVNDPASADADRIALRHGRRDDNG
jgi:hypothetical protein